MNLQQPSGRQDRLYRTYCNESRDCSAKGCTSPRIGLGSWCRHHKAKVAKYGHPYQGALRRTWWDMQRASALALIAENKGTHPGLQRALSFLSQWMHEGAAAVSARRSIPAASELQRLIMSGVTADMVLAEVAAINAFLDTSPTQVRDDRAWDVAVSRAVLQLAPARTRKTQKGQAYQLHPTAGTMTYIGEFLRRNLGPIVTNLRCSLESPEEAAARHQAEAMLPLKHPTPAAPAVSQPDGRIASSGLPF